MPNPTVEERVRRRLENFLSKTELQKIEFRANTDLINEVGFTSLQGLEFVLDLCDEFDFDFPADFNPFVDDQRRRGQTVHGLVRAVEVHLATKGASNGKK